MVRDVWTTILPRLGNEEIYVAKVPKGTALNGWLARKVMNAMWAKIPLEKIGIDVVVIDGEPHEQPTVIGSSPDAGNFVRSMTSQLSSIRWQLMKLDW
jgi:hypothetical protein